MPEPLCFTDSDEAKHLVGTALILPRRRGVYLLSFAFALLAWPVELVVAAGIWGHWE